MLGVRLPDLPLTEEGWLHDSTLRESFLARIFTHHRMRTHLLDSPSRGKLVAFHAEHKLLYMAHSPSLYGELGRIAAQVADQPLPATIQLYATQAMAALGQKSTPDKEANVLQHILGYFKNVLAPTEKQELLSLIDDFRAGLEVYVGLLSLTVMETVLGIDNVIFISILADKLPREQQATARRLGLALALVLRIGTRSGHRPSRLRRPGSGAVLLGDGGQQGGRGPHWSTRWVARRRPGRVLRRLPQPPLQVLHARRQLLDHAERHRELRIALSQSRHQLSEPESFVVGAELLSKILPSRKSSFSSRNAAAGPERFRPLLAATGHQMEKGAPKCRTS